MNESHSRTVSPPPSPREPEELTGAFQAFSKVVAKNGKHEDNDEPTLKIDRTKKNMYVPKIQLEVLVSRSSLGLFVLIYAFFLLSIGIDIYDDFESIQSVDKHLSSTLCPSLSQKGDLGSITTSNQYGCYDSVSSSWIGIVKDVHNVMFFSLESHIDGLSSASSVQYSSQVWACYQRDGCGNDFHGYDDHSWMKVTSVTNVVDSVTPKGHRAELEIFKNVFQNQESIASVGIVKSYFIEINMLDPSTNPLASGSDDIHYTFVLSSYPTQRVRGSIILFGLVFTLIVLSSYGYKLYWNYINRKKVWLSEQKWMILFFMALIFYQNPVAIIQNVAIYSNQGLAFAAYICDHFAEALLFTIWLCFSDRISKTKSSRKYFYFPKIAFGILVFVLGIYVTMNRFPSYNPFLESKNPVASLSEWSPRRRVAYCVVASIYVIRKLIWMLLFAYNFYFASKMLAKLPYLHTRYLQLVFSFFGVQTINVVAVYMLQYIGLILSLTKLNAFQSAAALGGVLASQSCTQVQVFGLIVILTAYISISAYPFSHVCSKNRKYYLSKFIIRESEMQTVVRNNLLVLSNRGPSLRNESETPLVSRKSIKDREKRLKYHSKLVETGTIIFCIELAIFLSEHGNLVYFDPPGFPKTPSHSPGDFEIESLNCRLIAAYSCNEDHTFCYIARENAGQQRLIVSFRGTITLQQWKTDINMILQSVNFYTSSLPDVDKVDGLDEGTDSDRASTTSSQNPFANGPVPMVHRGIWKAYDSGLRTFLHANLRKELSTHPSDVLFTGHSLGGALCTFAALDFTIHSKKRIEDYLRRSEHHTKETIEVVMYNFGSPRCGDKHFAQLYNTLIPNSFRVEREKDVIPGTPLRIMKYEHIGRRVVVDEFGSVLVDPTAIDAWLRVPSNSSFRTHAMDLYRTSLQQAKYACLDLMDILKQYTQNDDSHVKKLLKWSEEMSNHSNSPRNLSRNKGSNQNLTPFSSPPSSPRREAARLWHSNVPDSTPYDDQDLEIVLEDTNTSDMHHNGDERHSDYELDDVGIPIDETVHDSNHGVSHTVNYEDRSIVDPSKDPYGLPLTAHESTDSSTKDSSTGHQGTPDWSTNEQIYIDMRTVLEYNPYPYIPSNSQHDISSVGDN